MPLFALLRLASIARRRHRQSLVLLAAWPQLHAWATSHAPSVRRAAFAVRHQCSLSLCTTMSDETAIKWKKVAKSIRTCLEHNNAKQNLASDDRQLFLDNLKRDTSTVSRLHKFLDARGESKSGEFRDSANSRFQNFCQKKRAHPREEQTKAEERRKRWIEACFHGAPTCGIEELLQDDEE